MMGENREFMRKVWFVPLLMIMGCQNTGTDVANDLSLVHYSVVTGYPNAEPGCSDARNVYIFFNETRYILNVKFEFSQKDTVALSECALLEFDDSVDVDEWIEWHHADVTNEYTFIDPEKYVNDTYRIDLKVVSTETLSKGYYKARFNVSFEYISFESSDAYISTLSLDSLMLYSDGNVVFIGPADSIVFSDPASHMTKVVDCETSNPVTVRVCDKNGYHIDSSCTVKCVSLNPDIAIISDSIRQTDMTGSVIFYAAVTNGNKNDTFTIITSLSGKPTVTDTAYLEVGCLRN